MQIPPLGAGALVLERPPGADGVAGTRAPADVQAPRADAPRPAATPPAPIHAGLRALDPQRNARVASAQQALAFLDQLTPRLRNLRSDLQRVQADQPVPAERLERQRQRLQQLWEQRASGAGGELDAQLRYSPGEPARRGFAVRGLTAAPQAAETLVLALGLPSAARPGATVALDPQATPRQQAAAFDQALRPLGLRAEAGADGGLRFSVAEPRWPLVRDALSVRGEGRLFAAGRLHQVAVDPEPALLTPEAWRADATGAQPALQQLGQALKHAEGARETARAVLAQDRAALAAQDAARDADWAARFGQDFAAALRGDGAPRDDGYRLQAALGAALWGLHRQRVERLLDGD